MCAGWFQFRHCFSPPGRNNFNSNLLRKDNNAFQLLSLFGVFPGAVPVEEKRVVSKGPVENGIDSTKDGFPQPSREGRKTLLPTRKLIAFRLSISRTSIGNRLPVASTTRKKKEQRRDFPPNVNRAKEEDSVWRQSRR